MSRPRYDPEEENDSFDEAKFLDYARELGIDPDSEPELMQLARKHLSQHLLPEREKSKSETGDDTGDVSPVEDNRRKRSGRTKKRSSQEGEKNSESSVWVSEFGEKMVLFHPAFNVDVGETSEEKVSEMDGDGSDLSGDSLKIEERKHRGKKGPGASKRSDTRKRRESKCQSEEDSVDERLEARRREEVESRKAKAKKKSDEERRRQTEHQNSAKEELKGELMEPSSGATFLNGAECQSEVDSLKAQMREEVEQLQPEFDLELEAKRGKATEVQEEGKQLWSLYQEEIRRSVKLDNEERLEKLREELRTEVNTVEQKYKNEVSAQRKNFLSALQEEKESMRASHAQHLEKLRSEFEKQKQQIQHMQQVSELQRQEEQLELRAKEGLEELRQERDDLRQERDELRQERDELRQERDELRQERDELRQERDELRQELQKAAAEGEKAIEVLQKTRQEWEKAKTDGALLKKERDKAVQMCATAVEEMKRMKKKDKAVEKRHTLEKCQKSSSSSLDTSVERRKTQKSRSSASSSEDSESSLLTEDTGGSVDCLLTGSRSSKDQREGDKTLDTEQVAHVKNQGNDLEEKEDERHKEMEALSKLKQERDHLKEELQDIIEEKVKESMDMVLKRTEVLMTERDRVMTQRIREEKEELEKNLKRLQKICSLFSQRCPRLHDFTREMEQDEGSHHLFRQERTSKEEAGDTDSLTLSSEPNSVEESCCCVSSRIHSHFPTLERDRATVKKMDTLGTASSPWIRGDNHRVPAGYYGSREPGYSCRSCLLPGIAKDLLPIATMKPTHCSHVLPSANNLQFRQSSMVSSSSRVEEMVNASRRWLEKHGKDVNAPLLASSPLTSNKSSLFYELKSAHLY